MTPERLYMIRPITSEADDEFAYDDDPWAEPVNPEGWREYAIQHPRIDDDADFFIPRRAFAIFRSRSSAKDNLGYFTRWGIEAEIVECTPTWETIPEANARRAYERSTR